MRDLPLRDRQGHGVKASKIFSSSRKASEGNLTTNLSAYLLSPTGEGKGEVKMFLHVPVCVFTGVYC